MKNWHQIEIDPKWLSSHNLVFTGICLSRVICVNHVFSIALFKFYIVSCFHEYHYIVAHSSA